MEICPKCRGILREIEVRIDSKISLSYSCRCGYFNLDNFSVAI